MDNLEFGKTLKKILLERNMTQKDLAEAVGMDPVTLNRYIKNDRKIPLPALKKIARQLDLEPEELFGTKDPDFITWHYGLLEGAQIDIERGIAQAIEQGRDKSFIFPILRKYYTREEIQDLLDSYGEDADYDEKNENEGVVNYTLKDLTERLNRLSESIKASKTPPESLFEGASTADKIKLMDSYFKYINNDKNGKS